jgi:Baseplate J-like protein
MSSFTGVNDLTDLTSFIVETVNNYDSTIDTSTTSAFYTGVIQPIIDRLGPDPYDTDLRTFILDRLKVEFPDLVLQDGEPIDDYAVKIMTVLLEPFRRQIRQVSNGQSFADPTVLTEQEANDLGANYFTPRKPGNYSTGVARLYYSAPRADLISPNNVCHDGSGGNFIPVQNQQITADNMLFNFENNLYFFDVIVRADKPGAAYNLDPGSLTSIDNAPQVVQITNKAKFQEGGDEEDTITYVSRVQNSLTEKSLVTYRGIAARLNELFDNIQLVQTIGFGDPEMMRDILTGSGETAPYGYFIGNAGAPGGGGGSGSSSSSNPQFVLRAGHGDGDGGGGGGGDPTTLISLDTDDFPNTPIVLEDGSTYDSFINAGVKPGDYVEVVNFWDAQANDTIPTIQIFTVVEVDDQTLVLSGELGTSISAEQCTLRRSTEILTISGIPGGILQPTTPSGTIQIQNNQVHIGGMMDVFIRASAPTIENISLTSIVDANPLHFGVDLESFGGQLDPGEYVYITEPQVNGVAVPSTDRFGVGVNNHILVKQCALNSPWGADADLSTVPWKPTSNDIGRFIELYYAGQPPALLKITNFLDEEYIHTSTDPASSNTRAVRLQVELVDQFSNTAYTLVSTSFMGDPPLFTVKFRMVEQTTVRDRVRDRRGSRVFDNLTPTIYEGVDFTAPPVSTKIGDSVVIETGDDAGIYSIRRILDSIGSGDTLVLDRKLSNTVTPDGTGDGTGLRYRVADHLTVDLVTPKVLRIPLGEIFLGEDLNTIAGSNTVTVVAGTTTNFLLAGVQAGDTLEILSGGNKGTYSITAVAGLSLTLSAAPQNTLLSQGYSIYKAFTGINRPLVRVNKINLLDANSQPTGITIPYGAPIDARALGVFSNQNKGNVLESYVGATGDFELGNGDYYLTDGTVDFVAAGVQAGYRISIFNTRSAGNYTVVDQPDGGVGVVTPNDPTGVHTIQVAFAADGGTPFAEPVTGTGTVIPDVHYTVGLPSTGVLRFYFLEPTSIAAITGLGGGRLLYSGTGTPLSFRFSPVNGYTILPAPGALATYARDMRVAEQVPDPDNAGEFLSVVELTDTSHLDVLGMEFMPGDLLEVNQQLSFRTMRPTLDSCTWNGDTTVYVSITTGIEPGRWVTALPPNQWTPASETAYPFFRVLSVTPGVSFVIDNPEGLTIPTYTGIGTISATFEELGIFGTPAGLSTLVGSNLVSVPPNSLIDFWAMDGVYPLTGQILIIDSGPDAGRYTIEQVVSAKQLRLSTVMTSSTQSILGNDISPRALHAVMSLAPDAVSGTDLMDIASAGQLVGAAGHYITIFETTRGDYDGCYQIQSIVSSNTVDLNASSTQIVNPTTIGASSGNFDPYHVGPFSWVRTSNNTNVSQPFHTYRSAATKALITEVASRAQDIVEVERGTTTLGGVGGSRPVRLLSIAPGTFAGVAVGDRLEILDGPNQGVYPIGLVYTSSQYNDYLEIIYNPNHLFPVMATAIPYRIRGGICGSRTMLTLGQYENDERLSVQNVMSPYVVVRPGVFKVCSTTMSQQNDGIFYYVDIDVESDGSGDDYNLPENARLVIDNTGDAAGKIDCDGYTYDVAVGGNILTFSPLEEVSLVFSERFLPVGNTDNPANKTALSGRNIQIAYEQSTTTKLVHDLLTSDTDRPENSNPLARHFLPSYVYSNLTYVSGQTPDEVGTAISNFINRLGANTALHVSDLESFLVKAGATYIENPITLATVTHDIDRSLIVDRSQDQLGGTNKVPYHGTGRISAFFAILGSTLLVNQRS